MSNAGKGIIVSTANGITLSNFIAIQNLSDKIAMQCSKLIYSIPFLAFGLVKGAESGLTNMVCSSIGSMQHAIANTANIFMNFFFYYYIKNFFCFFWIIFNFY